MPWKECSVMDERLRFVAQLLDGEPMTEVCRAFGISRRTGAGIRIQNLEIEYKKPTLQCSDLDERLVGIRRDRVGVESF